MVKNKFWSTKRRAVEKIQIFPSLMELSCVPDMVSKAVEFGMPALALTDHGYPLVFQILTPQCAVSILRPLKTLDNGATMGMF